MGYSRRSRFIDGKSSLHRVEFAREFETRLAGTALAGAARNQDAAHGRTGDAAGEMRAAARTDAPTAGARRATPSEGQAVQAPAQSGDAPAEPTPRSARPPML